MTNEPNAHDKTIPENSSEFHTGITCITAGCQEPAGTAWSPYWCWRHNAERLDLIDAPLVMGTILNT